MHCKTDSNQALEWHAKQAISGGENEHGPLIIQNVTAQYWHEGRGAVL
jgi:hypothetical protein